MGVHGLWDILAPTKKTFSCETVSNQRLCVDLPFWLAQLQKANGGSIKDKPFLRGLFHRLRHLIALNNQIILVADGDIPAVKLATYFGRLGIEDAESTRHVKANNLCQRPEGGQKRNVNSEFSRMVREAMELAAALGIPCITSPQEAEAQCAVLNAAGLVDACVTADSDVFLFGARVVYKDISVGKKGEVVSYSSDDIEMRLGLNQQSLIALGLMLGSDYDHQGVHGIGQQRAMKVVKALGPSQILQVFRKEGVPNAAKRVLNSQQGRRGKGKRDDNDSMPGLPATDDAMRAMDAYCYPVCHAADSDVVRRAVQIVSRGIVDLEALKAICARSFDWSPEKTESYVLPQLAERDLRKAALVATSSTPSFDRALSPQLQYIPERIVKVRMALGREHYEVAWRGAPALVPSVVPANIFRQAYPWLVNQFEAEKAAAAAMKRRKGTKTSKASSSAATLESYFSSMSLASVHEGGGAPPVRMAMQPRDNWIQQPSSSITTWRRQDQTCQPTKTAPKEVLIEDHWHGGGAKAWGSRDSSVSPEIGPKQRQLANVWGWVTGMDEEGGTRGLGRGSTPEKQQQHYYSPRQYAKVKTTSPGGYSTPEKLCSPGQSAKVKMTSSGGRQGPTRRNDAGWWNELSKLCLSDSDKSNEDESPPRQLEGAKGRCSFEDGSPIPCQEAAKGRVSFAPSDGEEGGEWFGGGVQRRGWGRICLEDRFPAVDLGLDVAGDEGGRMTAAGMGNQDLLLIRGKENFGVGLNGAVCRSMYNKAAAPPGYLTVEASPEKTNSQANIPNRGTITVTKSSFVDLTSPPLSPWQSAKPTITTSPPNLRADDPWPITARQPDVMRSPAEMRAQRTRRTMLLQQHCEVSVTVKVKTSSSISIPSSPPQPSSLLAADKDRLPVQSRGSDGSETNGSKSDISSNSDKEREERIRSLRSLIASRRQEDNDKAASARRSGTRPERMLVPEGSFSEGGGGRPLRMPLQSLRAKNIVLAANASLKMKASASSTRTVFIDLGDD